MKVQWRLINIETGKPMAILGDPFELDLDDLAKKIADQFLNIQIKGTGGEIPSGILNKTVPRPAPESKKPIILK